MNDCYVVAYLYEPGMNLALVIARSPRPPVFGRPQVIALTANEHWDSGGYGERQKAYREYLIQEAK